MGFGELANGVIQGVMIGLAKSAGRDAKTVEVKQNIETQPVSDQELEDMKDLQRKDEKE